MDSIINSISSKHRKRALERVGNIRLACEFLDQKWMLKGKLLEASNEGNSWLKMFF